MDLLSFVKKSLPFLKDPEEPSPRASSLSYEPLLERLDDLEGLYVRDIMTPRTVIEGLDVDLRTEKIAPLLENKPAHLLVYRGDLDHVLGWMSLKEVQHQIASGDLDEDAVHDIGKVSENLSLKELFLRFVTVSHPLFLVINQEGRTAGIVTLKNLLDVFFGFKIQADDQVSQ
jgi:CBS domain containing-hemolysin-like protein